MLERAARAATVAAAAIAATPFAQAQPDAEALRPSIVQVVVKARNGKSAASVPASSSPTPATSPPPLEGGASVLAVLADGMGGAPAKAAAPQSSTSSEDRCEWLSVGDSFLLLCRSGSLARINPLHIYATELDAKARRGEITREAALAHPDRHSLTNVVMGWPMEQIAMDQLALRRGDVVLLASDGLATLPEAEIAAICTQGAEEAGGAGTAQWIADTLLCRIEQRRMPRQDNATVVVVLPSLVSGLGTRGGVDSAATRTSSTA